jgi:DNA-binding XRE family transcriptional regulator
MVLGELTLGQAMKMWRESQGWSKSQMAKFLETSRRNYWMIETGRNVNPRLNTFFPFLRAACTFEARVGCPDDNSSHYHIVSSKGEK